MRDRVISLAQFAELEAQAKYNQGEPRRGKWHKNRDRRRQVEVAILSAKARELGMDVNRDDWINRPMYRPHTVEVNDEIALHVDHHGPYVYLALSRRGSFRGRFTPAEVRRLLEVLSAARLPFRPPHKSRSRAARQRA